MANKVHSIKPKEREFGNLKFYYTDKDVAVKVGIQFFKIVQDFANKRATIKNLLESIEKGEIKDLNDLYVYMRKGYTLNPTTQEKFMNYLKEK